jgi:alcohol dehydrogenase class IV
VCKVHQTDFFGYGSIDTIFDIIKEKHVLSLFLVADRASFRASGAEAALKAVMNECSVRTFMEFEPNPCIEDVKKGISVFRQHDFDAVVAVGGGSVIDMAKLITIFAHHTESPELLITKKISLIPRRIPLIAVPTTAGTGSEATHFAVVYMNRTKYSVADESILPDYAIIDPALTLSMPAHVTAVTGLDALSQGIESYWSVHSTDESRKFSETSIRLVLDNLKKAVLSPGRRNRENMARAAHLAGKAINITKTTAPHAFSYYLTEAYHIPHGHAVGMTLGHFIVYNSLVTEYDAADRRGHEYVKQTIHTLLGFLGAATAEEARKKLMELMKDIGLETDLGAVGLKKDKDIDAWLANVNLERLANNPRKADKGIIREMLVSSLYCGKTHRGIHT